MQQWIRWIAVFLLLALGNNSFATSHKIAPNTAYRLTFDVEGNVEGERWAVYMRDASGYLPFDGALEGDWQVLKPGKKSYTHLFYSSSDAATLDVTILSADKNIKASNIQLEEWKDASGSLLLNGSFTAGNLSGWSEMYNSELVEEDGKSTFRVNQNGYALTDFTPVVGGGEYQFRDKRHNGYGPNVYAYNASKHFMGAVPRERSGRFTVPQDAAYVRFIYKTTHEHIESLRTTHIIEAELVAINAPAKAASEVERNIDWEVVLAAGSDEREVYAARELCHWIGAITGKTPRLMAEPSGGQTRKIFIGSSWAKGFPDDLEKLQGTDGYAIRTRDQNIYVFSGNPRGALYGVYGLLERNTDIIWPRPNPEFEAIFTKTPTIVFSEADVLSIPVFEDRFISKAGEGDFRNWQGRNGLNSPHTLHTGNSYLAWLRGAQLGYSGSYHTWLGRGGALEDEKVLPLIDGKRDKSRWRQPCYTYQGTVEGIAAGIRKALQALPHREMEYIHATISDNWSVCGDAGCLAPIPLPNGQRLETKTTDASKNPLFFSTRNFMMLNKVAENLKRDYPDIQIGTHAYIFTAEPPAVAIDSAIIPGYAAYPTQNVRYPILSGEGRDLGSYDKGMWKRRFEQWGKIKAGELGTFGYYYPDGFNAVADTVAADFSALAKYKAVEAHTEGFPAVDEEELTAWDADAIEKWVIAKLMWDPSQDPEELRKEYIRRVYHGAEQEMTEFYELIRKAWHEAPESVFINCHTSQADVYEQIIVDQGIEDDLQQLLVKAEKSASSAQGKSIVQRHIAYFEQLGATLGRVFVHNVPESTNEWRELTSPHWEKATVVKDFTKVRDWRGGEKDMPSDYPTVVRVMHDKNNLYVRFDGDDSDIENQVIPTKQAGEVFPNGDRFELRLETSSKHSYYFALGPGGHYYSYPSLKEEWDVFVHRDKDSWTGILAIPLAAFGDVTPATIGARFGRVARLTGEEREESSSNGSSIYNEHSSLWLELVIK